MAPKKGCITMYKTEFGEEADINLTAEDLRSTACALGGDVVGPKNCPLEPGGACMTSILQAALAYAAAGLPVFPVSRSKVPLVEGGFHAATTDPGIIASWYGQRPDAGIGMPMGPPTKVWAFDIDVEKIDPRTGEVIPSGDETLAPLVDRHG